MIDNAVILGSKYVVRVIDLRQLGLVGRVLNCDQEIQICESNHPENIKAAFLHELTHAIDFRLSLGLTEQQVQGVAAGMFDVMMNNQCLHSWLFVREDVT